MRVVARSEVEFLAAEDGAGGEKPGGAEENEDKTDDDCHFLMPFCSSFNYFPSVRTMFGK